jgi:hypothetical protein
MTGNVPVEVALAILTYEDKFLMQLRDNIPTILYPGVCGGYLVDTWKQVKRQKSQLSGKY